MEDVFIIYIEKRNRRRLFTFTLHFQLAAVARKAANTTNEGLTVSLLAQRSDQVGGSLLERALAIHVGRPGFLDCIAKFRAE
jgi:hypothetical protein